MRKILLILVGTLAYMSLYAQFTTGTTGLYLANLHTSFLCNLIYPTFSRILLYSC